MKKKTKETNDIEEIQRRDAAVFEDVDAIRARLKKNFGEMDALIATDSDLDEIRRRGDQILLDIDEIIRRSNS